jgi:Stage II sporulation protein E (SpoIIE)
LALTSNRSQYPKPDFLTLRARTGSAGESRPVPERPPGRDRATGIPDELEARVRACEPATVTALAGAARAGKPLHLSRLDPALGSHYPSESWSSAIATPRGELVGAVVLLGHPPGSDDALMLDHFSQAVAVALENQRLYAVEHQIALTLQHAMFPQSVPQPASLDVAVCYRAASDTVEIGGDFYEVMVLDDHTTLLAIGDVAGHSLRAATVMAELRYSLRAFAMLGLEASDTIHRLNVVISDRHPDLTATMCIAEIDSDAREMRITNAGHIWPFLSLATAVEAPSSRRTARCSRWASTSRPRR